MQIYLVRHGQTDWNREQRLQGWADIPLNAEGRHEARLLAEKLSGVDFSLAYCSDLDRAYETASIVLEGKDVEICVDPRLREMGFGPLEGDYYGDAKTDDSKPLHKLFSDPYGYVPEFGGESLPYLESRLSSFVISTLAPLAESGFDGNILVAAHGIVTRALLRQASELPYSEFWKLPVGNCFACILGFDGKKLFVTNPSV